MRILPLHHISIRVPWHDNRWNGTVCNDPVANVDCIKLMNINENKDDAAEELLKSRSWMDLADEQLPPCVRERAGFMAPFPLVKMVKHPYTEGSGSNAHDHFDITPLPIPAYSAPSLPFRWLLKREAVEIADRHGIDFRTEYEDRARELIGFDTNWVQDKRNHDALLGTFYSAMQANASLCFFYAKQVPLVEDHRRVLVGIGRVVHTGDPVEYRYKKGKQGELKSLVWERAIQHSIRPSFDDGFLFPYHAVLEQMRGNPDLDPRPFVAFAPEDHWDEFSYASELVTNDGAIAALLIAARVLHACQGVIPGEWTGPIQWVSDRLAETWSFRGPCPGLGAALSAARVPNGTLVAYELGQRCGDNENPWPLVDAAIKDPTQLSPELGRQIGSVIKRYWASLSTSSRALLELISRFDLTVEQAERVFDPAKRHAAGLEISDEDILSNPYLLYELDRGAEDAIPVTLVDRGVFPDPVIRTLHPLPDPTLVEDALDPRRVRALVVSVLEEAAAGGDTLLPADRVADAVADLDISPACSVNTGILAAIETDFVPAIQLAEMTGGSRAYQLEELSDAGVLIRSTVEKRLSGRRNQVVADWATALIEILRVQDPSEDQRAVDEEERRAREEKVAALEELSSSRISVLIGPAGTGKTTLLSALVAHPSIAAGGVLMLAPTGKARVQVERRTELTAQTIAQFLLKRGRYDWKTDRYSLSPDGEKVSAYKTVIIDECSMMTEQQLAATLDALKGVDRLILVGDYRQLPPIGPGRPFVDIVARLRDEDREGTFPRVYRGYCELTVRRRQKGGERDDLLLAEWFSGDKPGAGGDEIWERLVRGERSETLSLVPWKDDRDLQEKLVEVVIRELDLKSQEDELRFGLSIGGSEFKGEAYFHNEYGDRLGAGRRAEDWQILSAVRGNLHGVEALNRLVQHGFRPAALKLPFPEKYYLRKVPKPVGPQGILYGDKVINLRNGLRDAVFAEEKKAYVANGEIGIVVGEYKGKAWRLRRFPKKLEVEFSTQLGVKIVYSAWRDDSDPPLELAYALTIHKAQGSEFGLTILVIPDPCRPLTRELLYTALTRQRDRVVLMYQGDIGTLRRYADPWWSETAGRMTNLFRPPAPRLINERFLEEHLIHMTRSGHLVRSKSEVVIADLLFARKIEYDYERELILGGSRWIPDFTIEDANSGRTVFWEHLGMLHDPRYRRKWERKLKFFREHGVEMLEEDPTGDLALVTTRDDERGAISSQQFESVADQVLAWL